MKSLTITVADHLKVISIKEVILNIIENGLFLPQYGLTKSQQLIHKTIFTNISLGDNSNLGTIIGMTLLGLVGFLVLGFTILGGIGGGVLGIVLGRIVGKKIHKKNQLTDIQMTYFDILIIRVSCLLKWASINVQKETHIAQNFIVQRLLSEIKPLLHYKYFNQVQSKKAEQLIKQIQQLLVQQNCLIVISLNYLLVKEYLKIQKEHIIYSKFSDHQVELILNFTINNILTPFLTLFNNSKQQNPLIQKLCSKISKLLLNPHIQQIQDEEMDLLYIKQLAIRLSENIYINSLESYLQQQKFSSLYIATQEINDEVKIDVHYRPKSAIEIFSGDFIVNDEVTAQKPVNLAPQFHRAKSLDNKNIEDQMIDEDFSQKFQQPSIKKEPSINKSVAKSSVFSNQVQYSSELNQKFELLANLIEEPTNLWEEISKSEGQAVYKTLKNDSASIYIKGYSLLPGIHQQTVYEAIHNTEKRVKWDKMLLNFHVIEQESDAVDVVFYYVESPMGVSNREFCQKRIARFNFPKMGDICLLYFSVNSENVPKYKGHVRATSICGYIIENSVGGTRLHFCVHTDVGGKIPKSLVNFVAARAPLTWIQSLKKVSLDHEVYKWLLSQTIVKHQQIKSTGRVELDENQSKLFINGIKFGEALNKLLESRNIHVPNLSEQMKNQQTPGVKLFNWNILQDAFQKINMPLDNDIKKLIVQGDTEMMNELLKDMMEFDNQRKQQTRGSVRSSEDSSFETSKKPPSRPASKLPLTKYDQQVNNNELILEEVDSKKPLNESKSLLDFFITGLSRHLSLKPQQAASLLSNGNKYLAHLLVKGVKGEFETLVNWLSEIYASISRVFNFIEQQDSNVTYFFSTIKPGLLSKEQEITLWTLRIMGRVYFELAEMEMHQLGYEWFCRENGGLTATFMCLQRHPYLVAQVCELYSQVARFNITDFFTVQFKKQLAEKCVDTFNTLIESLFQQKTLKDEMISQGIIQYWAQTALKMADSDQLQLKIQGLKYLSLNWLLYPIQFEEDQNYPNQYLFLMKKGTRDSSNVLKFFSLNMLFRLLDKLATDRNPFAAVLYKKLTFSLIENYNEIDVREFMLYNFMHLIQKYSTIPIDILLEPLIKQVMLNDAVVNLPDMALLKFISKHPKMKIRLAILLLDLLAKIYLNSVTMSHLAFNPIQMLLARFAESPLLREYAFKLCKIALALHYGSLKAKRSQFKMNDLSVLSQLQLQNNDHEILEAQKRSQIIELVKFIINMQQDELNEQIKPLLCHFYLELQQIGIRDKGVISLLNLFGNPEEIVQVIKNQWEAERQEQEEILKQSQIAIDNEFVSQPQQTTPQTIKSNKQSEPTVDDPFNDLRQKEIEEEKKFLAQNGVGFKKRVVELERGKQTQPAQQKKKQHVDPRVLENIANIRIKKEEEILKKQQEEEEKRKRIEMLQKKAQHDIQKRTQVIEKPDEKKIELIDLDEHENHDFESMNIAIKRNHKAIKYLFSKYSNTTNHASKKQYFGELQEQFEIIQLSDMIRLMKDFQVNISKEELQSYIKAINQKYSDSKTDLNLDFQNFERLIAQLSMKIEAQTFQKSPAGFCLDSFIYNFGQLARAKNENHLIFLDPDNINIDPDRDLIRQLNYQLQTQDVVVPNKFKKVTEKQFNQKFEFRNQVLLGLETAWLDCHEIVNSIISETFKTNIMEPLSELKLVWKVKPNPQGQQEQVVAPKQRDNSQQKKVTNKVVEDKMQKQQEEEQKKIEAEEKRKRHQEKLKQEYLRKKKEKEEQEQLKKQEERQELIEKAEREKRQQELLKKEAEEKKVKLREYKEKMAEENKVKEAQNIEIQKVKQELERKQREEFQKKQKDEVTKLLEQKKKEFKDKEQQEKLKEQKTKEEMKEWKNNVENMLQQEQEIRQREKQMQQKIMQLYQDGEIQQIYKKYEKQLTAIYHAYQEYTDWKIENAGMEKELLQFKGFTNFASQFSIYPSIITPEDAQLIFRSITRERERVQQQLNEKNGYNVTPPKGMNFSEFQQALLRISIKGQKYFDLLSDKYQNNMKTIEMLALKKDQAAQEDGPLDKREDQYQQVDATSFKTLQGLMYFLDLPEDKIEMNSKLRALKLEFQKVAAQRDKKQIVQQKLTEEVKQPLNRKQSVGVKDHKDTSKEKQRLDRNKSQNARVESAKSKMKQSQKDQIQAVDENQLKKQSPPKKLEAVGPDGKKETWQVSKQD